MAHISLYRKFRPSTWDKLIGQDHIVTTLTNQIKSGTVSHAYLFTGTRGTGKTSAAKIFARAVNCIDNKNGSPCGVCSVCDTLSESTNMDIIEMDAASNNGVDEIRELRENIQYPPTTGKYKVYIIDEVHMLTGSAFNALLKTLEEPPSHAIFILATTEAHKLPQTILSRCMRFDFRLVGKDKLLVLLTDIFEKENYKFDKRGLELIIQHGEGSVRDTLSLADMCMSHSPDFLSYESVLEILGASDFRVIAELSGSILSGDISGILDITNKISERGKGVSTINKELSAFFRDMIAVKNIKGYKAGFSGSEYDEVLKIASQYDNYRIGRVFDILTSVENTIRYSTQPRLIFDAALVKGAELVTDPSIEGLISRVRMLEKKLEKIESEGVSISPKNNDPITAKKTKAQKTEIEGSKTANKAPQNEDNKKSSSTTIDIEKKLSGFAVEVEAKPVFAKSTKKDDESDDYNAKRVWGSLLTKIREEKYNFIYFALQNQEKITLEGTTLSLQVDDIATLELLSVKENMDVINKLLKEVMGEDYSFEYINIREQSLVARQDRMTLDQLFGNKLVDKNKQ